MQRTTAALDQLTPPWSPRACCPVAQPASNYSARALGDEIANLPGAPPVSFKMFSGFIDVSASGEAPGTRKMFYWFAEVRARAVPVLFRVLLLLPLLLLLLLLLHGRRGPRRGRLRLGTARGTSTPCISTLAHAVGRARPPPPPRMGPELAPPALVAATRWLLWHTGRGR